MAFSLYVHFPFCTNKCAYCDFYKELHNPRLEQHYYAALKTETELAARESGLVDQQISTIFIGGGTPSLTNLDYFEDWLSVVHKVFAVPEGIEFSIETNPESVTLENLRRLKSMGITRPVFGIQSFDPGLLAVLGRKHNPHLSQRAVYYANVLGFKSFGVDIIFGLPGQNGRMLTTDLEQVIDLDPPHVSYYQLTVEENTPLASIVTSGQVRMPDQELTLALYKAGCEHLSDGGYFRYEVSSFAKPGYQCLHNIGYWQGNDYLGLGPSAHSFISDQRFLNKPNLAEYLSSLRERRLPRQLDQSGRIERMVEAIMLGLRTTEGISRSRFSRRFGGVVEDHIDRTQYDLFVESGHIISDGKSIRLTDKGISIADEITRRLIK